MQPISEKFYCKYVVNNLELARKVCSKYAFNLFAWISTKSALHLDKYRDCCNWSLYLKSRWSI